MQNLFAKLNDVRGCCFQRSWQMQTHLNVKTQQRVLATNRLIQNFPVFRLSHHHHAIFNDIDLAFGWDFDSASWAAFESKLKLAYLVARATNEWFLLANREFFLAKSHQRVSASTHYRPTLTLRFVHTFKPNRTEISVHIRFRFFSFYS